MNFLNRQEAGKLLAKELLFLKDQPVVVLALPRGGVVLGKEIARALDAPLGLVLVRKIGHPYYADYAIGAVAEGEEPLYNDSEVATIDDEDWLMEAVAAARTVMEKRRSIYYDNDLTPPDINGKTVVLVDDGIATGFTMRAAVMSVQQKLPAKIIVAVPVASPDSVAALQKMAAEMVLLDDPDDFLGAVGAHFEEFEQVNDEEVRMLLREANNDIHQATAAGTPAPQPGTTKPVSGNTH